MTVPSLLFLAAFLFYLVGLTGTVPSYRDSGDLISAIHTLGIAHPPGYALYVIIGKLFVTLLPFGNIAYRVNVMSAFFAAATVSILFIVIPAVVSGDPSIDSRFRGNDIKSWTSLIVVFLFATSPAFVALARVAEMYTLSACLAVAILYCLYSNHPRGTSYAALLLGLGLSVHPTLIFLVPLFFISPARPLARSSALFFLLGLSIFLYLPLRAAQHPLLNWGDPSHWRNFWRVVTRADYGGLKLHPEQSVFSWTPHSVITLVKYFMVTLKGEWGWGGTIVGFMGIVGSLRDVKTRRWAALLLASWVLAGPALFLLSNLPLGEATTPAILQPYLLLVSVLWVPFVLRGFFWCHPRVGGDPSKSLWIPAFAGMTILLLASRPWSFTSQRNDFYAYDYARNILRSLPPGAVLYDPDDPTHFSIRALQTVENRRTDIVLLSFFRTRWGYEEIKRRWPELLPPIPIDSGQELERVFWTYSAHRRPFYAELPQKFGQIPYEAQGLVYAAQILPGPDPGARERAETLLGLYVMRGDFVTTHHPDFFTSHLISYYAAAQNNLGIEYANQGKWARAIDHYQAALQIEPDQTAAKANLAFALQKMPKLL